MAKSPSNSHDASMLFKFITVYWDVLLRGAVTTILSVINMNRFYVPIAICSLVKKSLMVDNSTLRQQKIYNQRTYDKKCSLDKSFEPKITCKH